MTPLAALLARRIAATGPISLGEYMAECLLHPEHGYYTTAEPFGASGDFTTAPETSQMFGELLGLWLAQCWLDQGAPDPFVLAEIGPGRGTLMADLWRATRAVPGFHGAARLHLVEASPRLRKAQAAALPDTAPVWCDTVGDLPDGPLFLIANEFFDALPVRQFTRAGEGWAETMVTTDSGGRLSLARAAPARPAALEHRLVDTREGDVVELCPAAAPIAAALGARIAGHGGAALIVDYGGWHSLGDTVQALRAHRFDTILAAPGKADITAHVDFEPLALAARAAGAAAHGPVPQAALLHALGITERASRLARSMREDRLEAHLAALHRLTAPTEMGTLFKALAILPRTADTPPGFAL